jgi:hypothetical protein
MKTWWATPTYQQETCWTTSLRPTSTSLQSTSRSTLNTCAEPGIPNSQWRLSSSRFKTVLTIRRQGGVLIGPATDQCWKRKIFATCHFMSACRRWNEKPSAEKTWTQFKSHFAAAHRQQSYCKENPLPQPYTTQLTPPSLRMKIRWPKPPLAL